VKGPVREDGAFFVSDCGYAQLSASLSAVSARATATTSTSSGTRPSRSGLDKTVAVANLVAQSLAA